MEDRFNSNERDLKRLQEDIDELNKYFEIFDKPFGILIYGEVENIFKSNILERSEDMNQYMSIVRKTVYNTPKTKELNLGMTERVENVIRGTFSN